VFSLSDGGDDPEGKAQVNIGAQRSVEVKAAVP